MWKVPIAEAVQQQEYLPTPQPARYDTALLLTIGQSSDFSAEMIEPPPWTFEPVGGHRGIGELSL